MHTRRRRLIIVSGVLLCMLIQGAQANPNHLEPLPPYNYYLDRVGYDIGQAVFTALIDRKRPVLWMIEWPSFSPPSAVMLRRQVEYDPNDDSPLQGRRVKRELWLLDHVAVKPLKWKTLGKGSNPPDIKPSEDVELSRTIVTTDFGKAVQEAWLNTLQLTRYAEDRRTGLDGTTFIFCYEDDIFGYTWSPNTCLPAMLMNLGRKLREIARSDEKNKEQLLKEADSLARRIAKEAEAEQIKLFGKKMAYITWSSVLNRAGRAPQTGEAR